jgi:chemotaxis protein MotB
MRNQLRMVAILAIGALGVSGCVSTSRYKKLVAEDNALMTKYDEALTKITGLEQQVTTLKITNESLGREKDDLKQQTEVTKNEYSNLVGQLQQELQEGQLQVTQYQNMLKVDVAEKIFFDSGSARLKVTGKTVLKKVGEALAQYKDKVIRVVGYTDNVPLSPKIQAIFPTNWELSAARATNVVRFLQDECKINPENLIAAGRGQYAPVASNDTPEGRQKNRRIEIMLMDKSVIAAMEQPKRVDTPVPAETAVPQSTPAPK